MADTIASLTEQVQRLHQEADALRTELDETNQGVLALYAELDMQADQLRQASDLKSRFLSYMSHEFRTPLGSILSITSLLADELDGPLSPEQQTQVGFIRSSARELREMVDDLLDLAKIEAGRITISPAWFDMFDLFSALRGMFRPIVDASSVDLIFEEPAGLPKLYTDDKKLAQILRNFISNALKFTLQGEVRVSARMESAHEIRFAVGHWPGHSCRAAQQLVRRLFPDRLTAAKTPARHRPGALAVQALCRVARWQCRGAKRPRRRVDVLCDHSSVYRGRAC